LWQNQAKYKNATKSQLPPHVYALADSAYQQMITSGKGQCFVISGESGAGKTESCKFIVTHLTELSHAKSLVEQRIIQVNPLLEAFGNATTVMNDNSSRFGKYIQMKFQKGHVTGAKINEYLLEKSRVVYQNPGELNFHIFYCLMAGLSPEEKKEYKLEDKDYRYVTNGWKALSRIREMKELQFEELQNAMDLVGFESEHQVNTFKCMSAILHLGNVDFSEDDSEKAHVSSSQELAVTAELLGVEADQIADLMTVQESVTRGEKIRRHLNKEKASVARDAIAKAMYDRIFRWIVNRTNGLLAPPKDAHSGETEIGILDIFGFESFDVNSFEQLCIDLANEQLQFYFNEHIFALELEEYRREGINTSDVKYEDNKPLLDFFLAKPMGVFSILDEQSNFPKATDDTFVMKLNQQFGKLSFYKPAKGTRTDYFGITHYAGHVQYTSKGFLEKNRDTLPGGAVGLMQSSTNELVRSIFLAAITRTGTLAIGEVDRKTRRGKTRKGGVGGGKKGGPGGGGAKQTVASQFKNSLTILMEKMNASNPHFVRCIKPSREKKPGCFDDMYVTNQLRYTGMLETTRIRREGYAVRFEFAEFVDQYKLLAADPRMPPLADSCKRICEKSGIKGFQIGKTKVFLKYYHIDTLVEELEKVQRAAINVQKIIRGFVARRRFKKLCLAAEDQAKRLTTFLLSIQEGTAGMGHRLDSMNKEDDSRPKEVIPPVPREPTPPPREPTPPPPTPPPPQIEEDSESEEEDDFNEDDDFIKIDPKARFKKFGKEGTRNASVRWFQETQTSAVKSKAGSVQQWFHGIITRRSSEQLLTDKPNGCFLIRVSETRFGYTLSFRVTGRCRHYMIDQTLSGKYIIVGESKVHNSLEALVKWYQRHPVNEDGDLLTIPCGQAGSMTDYSELLDEDTDNGENGTLDKAHVPFYLNPSVMSTKPGIRKVSKDPKKGPIPELPPRFV
jgi:myosin-3